MPKPNVLIQLDPDEHASVFDAMVAVDAGVDHLLQYASVRPEQVQPLVHGAIFTRGPRELKHTAIFIGGSRMRDGETLLCSVTDAFFGPMRVSVLLDSNGANTTAAAAVVAAGHHAVLRGAEATVLAATGPVGQRAGRLLARAGARVRVTSRNAERAAGAAEAIRAKVPDADVQALAAGTAAEVRAAMDGAEIVVSAGAAGVELLSPAVRARCDALRVAIDLNAVPPAGIGGVAITDRAEPREGVICYGAIGVGQTKMKIHRTAISRLFQDNTLVMDAEEIFALGRELEEV